MNAELGARLRATFAPDLAHETLQDCNADCENCGRSPVEYGGKAYISVDSYKRQLVHCTDCRSISIQAKITLGIAIEPATGFTLATFKGGYFVAPKTGKASLLVSGKYPDKISRDYLDVVPVGGHTAKVWLLENHQPGRYVFELSTRRERFSRHAMPCSKSHLVVFDTSCATKISLTDWHNSKAALSVATKPKDWIVLARGLTEGRLQLSSEKTQEQLAGDVLEFLAALPKSPLSRLFVLDALTAWSAT